MFCLHFCFFGFPTLLRFWDLKKNVLSDIQVNQNYFILIQYFKFPHLHVQKEDSNCIIRNHSNNVCFKKMVAHLTLKQCQMCNRLFETDVTCRGMKIKCSTCPLVFGFWELSHVIFLKLRKKKLPAKLSKFTKWQIFSYTMVLTSVS